VSTEYQRNLEHAVGVLDHATSAVIDLILAMSRIEAFSDDETTELLIKVGAVRAAVDELKGVAPR
jgi:hypothetical protein